MANGTTDNISNPKLVKIIDYIHNWQKGQDAEHISRQHRCLHICNLACESEGLKLPPSTPTKDTALDCFHTLDAEPTKWGWKKVEFDAKQIVLVFFNKCGQLPDGRI